MMKTVTEYFRDLAASDPAFGAHPAPLDAFADGRGDMSEQERRAGTGGTEPDSETPAAPDAAELARIIPPQNEAESPSQPAAETHSRAAQGLDEDAEAPPRDGADRPRPVPLTLIAGRRDESAKMRPNTPALSRKAPPEPGGAESFAAYAEKMNSQELIELFEAAAAHSALIEKQEEVSRAQLMRKVAEVIPGGVSREEALRAFGTLLRRGHLRKIGNGRYMVSEGVQTWTGN